ncbi:NAD(P)H-dependent oxidoreductase [Nocardia sp. PE-7]|uniref:FMN-dependent NADH-azoreductase n=1 Tax=Nocardia sp. PE-7 TaxID=3058426 RepID=UPI00265A985E|nr:NAD(P)H-dependent oxidoreductase [Nocardia sp. PE-7]WKG09980.1 NAD(P)H-dependent oxidoreductase [Nocardia sp. PE-7]
MTHLLHLDASARANSLSRELGREFVRAWRDAEPGGTYTYRDLAAEPTPFIDEGWTELCDAVLAAGVTDLDRLAELAVTPAARAAWKVVEPLLAQVLAADVILIGTPMYNYSVPASLKAWLDQVTFPRMSLGQRRFVVVTARGGAYSPGAPKAAFDYQERFLRDFFAGHFAVTDTVFVNAELANAVQDPNLAHLRDAYEASLAAARAEVRSLAKDYTR